MGDWHRHSMDTVTNKKKVLSVERKATVIGKTKNGKKEAGV